MHSNAHLQSARHGRVRPRAISQNVSLKHPAHILVSRRKPRVCLLTASAAETSTVVIDNRASDVADQDAAGVAPAAPAAPVFTTIKQLRLRSAAAYLPHPEKESYGGEDAHFVSNMAGGALGVADGVGGWADSGINPAEYSRMLMRVACAYIEGADVRAVSSVDSWQSSPCASLNSYDAMGEASMSSSSDGSSSDGSSGRDPAAAVAVVDPRAALDTAHKLTKLPGSATACVLQLCPEQKALIAANLGDSGFIVARQGEIVLRSSPKQHFFDCPLQFGSYPDHVDGTDTADDAELYQLPVMPGDVIVAGSDGLWDNVYSSEVVELLPKSPADIDAAADRIAKLARHHAADESFASPYSAEAKAQGYDWPWWMKVANAKVKGGKVQLGELTGGKMDDITVLVAMVEEVDVQVLDTAATAAACATAANGSSSSKVASSSGSTYSLMDASAGNGNGAASSTASNVQGQ